MSNVVRFGCTALAGTGKNGILKPNSDGTYTMPVGGLDVFNSIGQYYPYKEAESLFLKSGSLQRRIQDATLRGEYGHPKMVPGMSNEQFANRVMEIEETKVCCLFKEIFLDFNSYRDQEGRKIIGIMAKILPSGPYGPALKASFESSEENVCFSIRSFTDDFRDGSVYKRALRHIVTWDYVNEPGIAIAKKFKAPGLESLIDTSFTRGVIERGIENMKVGGLATESSLLTAQEMFKAFGWDASNQKKPAYLGW